MKQSIRSKHSFFESMKQAKEEFKALTEIHPELAELSPREIEVFDQLLSDKTLAKIAEEMVISYSSVHFHCKNIYRKLKLSSRRQLLMTYKDLYQ